MKIRNQFQDYKTEDLAKYYYEFVSLGQLFSSSSISSSSLVPNDWFSMERLMVHRHAIPKQVSEQSLGIFISKRGLKREISRLINSILLCFNSIFDFLVSVFITNCCLVVVLFLILVPVGRHWSSSEVS